ncbi:MAG TPA: aminotransferase class I/II-fold pyridoxal phosphate-dependent enzyme [Bryobacteraceae bacterium]
MITRRSFAARAALAGIAARMVPEMAYAQRALVRNGELPKEMVFLNANENPAGIPPASLAAMQEVLPTAWRYHYQEFGGIYGAMAKAEGLEGNQLIAGCGSSESLHIAVDAFTSPTRPLITVSPTYELPVELARALGHPVVLTKLRPNYTADVKKLAEEADKAHGGLIYICNPNNPTSAITTKQDLAWLVSNLPANTRLLVDEAYIHFGESPDLESALPYVRQGKDVIVTRTFSKIYGMAGLRVGFAAARPDIIAKLDPLRMNVISIVSARAVTAALADQKNIVPSRRAAMARTRRELCDWLRERGLKFIDPQANFMMIDVGRNAREFITAMPKLGVAPGRPFPPLDNMLRVSIGTDQDMARFREVFWKVYKG